jgi:outer membrane protein TolC
MFETARLYLQSLTYSDLIRAAEARIKSLQSLLDRANKLIQGGRAVPVDALKIQTRIAQVESDLAILRSGRRNTLSALAAVMGYEGDLPEPVYTTPSPVLKSMLIGRKRCCVRRMRQTRRFRRNTEIKASELAEQDARKSLLPRIDLRASSSNSFQYPAGFPQFRDRLLPVCPTARLLRAMPLRLAYWSAYLIPL